MANSTCGAPRPRRVGWVVAAAALAILLPIVGCGGSDRRDEADASATTGSDPAGTDALSTLLMSTLGLTRGEAHCVQARAEGRLDAATIESLIATPVDSPDRATFDEVLGRCAFSADATEATVARRPGVPFTYGDDPDLDRLWDQCAAEGTDSCDELFNRSAEGTEYESFADTCGGRGGPQVSCAPGALGSPTSTTSAGTDVASPRKYGDNADLDRLWDQCAAGDAQGCLALVFQAPAGSEYAAFGQSCGNRPGDPRCAGASG